ncbi:cache domain-containing sensor histidine kinase [Paenibacillus mendelii]|uniref:Sensor histidine kinase n=1 Tax=Paenibacillus mendelii TaxID=206163 RepID=A0ABV6J742_9BACL|nr:sensor histidine kinase [Paenibacillus mendelii]MCQ6564042.1 histidine kinase [Paenibacillus mendelii]
MQRVRGKKRWKLWTVTLLFMIVIMLVALQGYLVGEQSANQIETLHGQLISKNLESMSINIDNLLNQMIDFTRSFSSDKGIIDALLSPKQVEKERLINNRIQSFVSYYGLRIPLYVQIVSGDRVYSGITLHESEKERIQSVLPAFPWYKDIEVYEVPFVFKGVGKDFHDLLEDNQAFYVVQNIIYNKQKLGTAVIQMNQSLVQRLMRQVQVNRSATVLIADKDGRVLMTDEANRADLSSVSKNVASYAAAQPELAGSSNSFHMKWNDRAYFCTYYTVPELKWHLAVMTPTDTLISPSKNIWAFTLTIVVSSILIMIAALMFFTKKVTLPILRLSHMMRNIQVNGPSITFKDKGIEEVEILYTGIQQLVVRINDQVDQITNVEREKKDLELNLLHSQIRPHFLHNALNTIRWMAEIKRETSIAKALTALSRMLDYTLNRTNSLWSSLDKELAYIQSYIDFQEIRLMKTVTVHQVIDKDVLDARIPKLTLQPIVENSFLHGFAQLQERAPELTITVTRERSGLVLRLKDNGIGMSESTLKSLLYRGGSAAASHSSTTSKMTGIGMSNVIRRLELEFGERFHYQITSRLDEGTELTIHIPYISSKEDEPRESDDC